MAATGILSLLAFMICANLCICLYIRGTGKTPKALKSLIKRSWSWMDKPPTPTSDEGTLRWESDLIGQFLVETRYAPSRSSTDSGFGSQMFSERLSHLPPASSDPLRDDSGISVPSSDTIKKQNPSGLGEDSGISLSTGSPCPGRSSVGTPYGGNTGGGCSGIPEVASPGYLKQAGPGEAPSCAEEGAPEQTLQPLSKDYFTQGTRLGHGDTDPLGGFHGPWAQVAEGSISVLPAAFSPFSRVLLDFGFMAPSLGDVEIMNCES
ncbi:hypothetical protein FKM82_020857 [Ascaphus truei]